jgi:hypothetical protein
VKTDDKLDAKQVEISKYDTGEYAEVYKLWCDEQSIEEMDISSFQHSM